MQTDEDVGKIAMAVPLLVCKQSFLNIIVDYFFLVICFWELVFSHLLFMITCFYMYWQLKH